MVKVLFDNACPTTVEREMCSRWITRRISAIDLGIKLVVVGWYYWPREGKRIQAVEKESYGGSLMLFLIGINCVVLFAVSSLNVRGGRVSPVVSLPIIVHRCVLV